MLLLFHKLEIPYKYLGQKYPTNIEEIPYKYRGNTLQISCQALFVTPIEST